MRKSDFASTICRRVLILSDTSPLNMGNIVVVCSHVAKDNLPILRAIRTEPVEPEDSGWQFVCGCVEEEDDAEAEVWSINHVLENEPTLAQLLKHPIGTVLQRSDERSSWEISNECG